MFGCRLRHPVERANKARMSSKQGDETMSDIKMIRVLAENRLVRFLFLFAALAGNVGLATAANPGDRPVDYRILATSRTSTMETELNRAASEGFRFSKAMGGKSANGGQEIIVAMVKDDAPPTRGVRKYKLLATTRTSTMQKEMQHAADEGYEYREQTVFETAMGGPEVVVIMEFNPSRTNSPQSYRLLATTSTSTMQQELKEAGKLGFELVGLTVGKTAIGGDEIVAILQKD
jgi:hypothetical protein